MINFEIVPHCDDPACDLGSLEYKCPNCNRYIRDFDNWFKRDTADLKAKCKHCQAEFELGDTT